MRNKIKQVDGKFGCVTFDADQIRGFAEAGMSRTQIAALLRIDLKTLRRFLLQHNIDPARGAMGSTSHRPTPAASANNPLWTAWRA